MLLSESAIATVERPGYSRLRDLIRSDIIEGRLPPGSRLKIADLAARYASSGIPVREALQQLQGEGIVTFEPNRGARVRHIDEAFLRNIFEVRSLVEPYLIRWLVRHRSDAQLASLEEVQRGYDQMTDASTAEQLHQQNASFHDICYGGHYNDEAVAVAARHSGLIGAIACRLPRTRSRILQASREHWTIIEKVRLQDEEGAAAIVAEHVRHAGQNLIERMQAVARHRPPARRPVQPPLPPSGMTLTAEPLLATDPAR